MITKRYLPWRTSWTVWIVAPLFVILAPWLGHGVYQSAAESQLHITVHEGKLSAHLQDADVGDVLAAIGHQARLTILGHARPATRVSAQFTGISLDEGLRRLLRLASLSSTMVYARDPTEGAIVLTTIYVFEEGAEPPPTPQLAAEPPAEDRREKAGHSFAEALAQLSTALPPSSQLGEQDGTERFRALLERAPQREASPRAGEDNELARRVREALEQSLQPRDDTSPPDLPQ